MLAVVALSLCIALVNGHGYLEDPPNRSSLWRFNTKEYPLINEYSDIIVANYNDNQNFCGGIQTQISNDYKCGLCGDAYNQEQPRDNESGGKYGKGIIVKQYEQGSIIDVKVKITAHHKGYFEFRLIPWNDPTRPADLNVATSYLLENTDDYNTQYPLPPSAEGWDFDIKLKLPDDVICDQCVLQWRYHTGNSWGCDSPDNCGVGKGPQEEFYSCSDISIGDGPILPPPTHINGGGETNEPEPKTTSKKLTTSTTTTTKKPTTTTSGQGGNVVATTERPYPITTTTKRPASGDCTIQTNVLFPAEDDCGSFYQCVSGKKVYKTCAPGTVFNDVQQICDWQSNVLPPCGTKE